MALLRRLYRVEAGRLRFSDAATVQAVAEAIRARRPPQADEDGLGDLSACGQAIFSEMMDVLVAEAWRLSPPREPRRHRRLRAELVL